MLPASAAKSASKEDSEFLPEECVFLSSRENRVFLSQKRIRVIGKKPVLTWKYMPTLKKMASIIGPHKNEYSEEFILRRISMILPSKLICKIYELKYLYYSMTMCFK